MEALSKRTHKKLQKGQNKHPRQQQQQQQQQQQKEQQGKKSAPPGERRRSRYEYYTTVVMRRLSNPFRSSNRRSSAENTIPTNPVAISHTSQSSISLDLPLQKPQSPSAGIVAAELAYELEQIQTHVAITSARIRHLQERLEAEEPSVLRVTELKRQLKNTHRDLERLYFQVRGDHGAEMADPVREVVRGVWRAYRAMVKLEGRLRNKESRSSSIDESERDGDKRRSIADTGAVETKAPLVVETKKPMVVGMRQPMVVETRQPVVVEKQQGVYIPTGVRDSKMPHVPVKIVQEIECDEEVEEDLMHGGRPSKETLRSEIHTASSEALEVIDALPQLAMRQEAADRSNHNPLRDPCGQGHRHSRGLSDFSIEKVHPELWPQPRRSVIMRLQREEANGSLSLQTPDQQRRGSCNGFTITDMVMRGVEDHRFVLPYLHHIKHHEVRVLKQWLVDEGHLHNSGVVSCTEKLLHCVQLLQTGNRYETIAVLFSRSPAQVKSACREVMDGLLELYNETVDGDCEHEVYAPLWHICKKFVLNAQHAEAYYGFRWMEVVQVLVALNLYIGRTRGSPSPFEGEPFKWGKFLVPARSGQLRRISDRVGEMRNSSEESASVGDSDDSSIYDTPVIQIITR